MIKPIEWKGAQGMKNLYAKDRRAINKVICGAAPGFYTDEGWHGKNIVFEALERICTKLGLTWEGTFSAYGGWRDVLSGEPLSRKVWGFKVVDKENGRESCGVVVAAGAGTIAEPLSRYDIVAYL